MSRYVVGSTALERAAYDPIEKTLELVYRRQPGVVYRYHHVPPVVFARFKRAYALGAFVNRVVKPRYPVQKLRAIDAARRPLRHAGRRRGFLVGGFTRRRWALEKRGLSREQAYRLLTSGR